MAKWPMTNAPPILEPVTRFRFNERTWKIVRHIGLSRFINPAGSLRSIRNLVKIENEKGAENGKRVENKLISDHHEEDFNGDRERSGIFSAMVVVVVNRADPVPSRDRDSHRFVPYRFVFRLRIHGYFNELSAMPSMDGFVAGPLSPRARASLRFRPMMD